MSRLPIMVNRYGEPLPYQQPIPVTWEMITDYNKHIKKNNKNKGEMMKMNIFEQATRMKLRFQTTLGLLSVEELWGLELGTLDHLYRELDEEHEKYSRKTLAKDKENSEKEELELKISLIKHIYKVKEEDIERRAEKAKNVRLRNRLLELKFDKQDEKYKEMTEEELDKELEKLDET